MSVSGLTTMGIGFVVSLAMPFIPMGRRTYLDPDSPGEQVQVSEWMFLRETAGSELPLVLAIFLVPLALIGFTATTVYSRFPVLAVGILWLLAIWLLVWTVLLIMSVAWIVFPLALSAFVTAVFATRQVREGAE